MSCRRKLSITASILSQNAHCLAYTRFPLLSSAFRSMYTSFNYTRRRYSLVESHCARTSRDAPLKQPQQFVRALTRHCCEELPQRRAFLLHCPREPAQLPGEVKLIFEITIQFFEVRLAIVCSLLLCAASEARGSSALERRDVSVRYCPARRACDSSGKVLAGKKRRNNGGQ